METDHITTNTTHKIAVSEDVRMTTDAPCCIGIDIGTTNLCAFVLRLTDGTPVGIYHTPNASDLPAAFPGDKRQDVNAIYARVCALLDGALSRFPQISAIGLTGQMHGMVLCGADGQAISPLYTWQDGRAADFCEELFAKTGYRVSAGYGLATYYALLQKGDVPANTARICTVMDYTAARLCDVPVTVMHTTNAASLGLYDIQNRMFDTDALCALGIDGSVLPTVTDAVGIVGEYRGIPVTTPIGDNQASFLGSVSNPETTALANFGTGSQISLLSPTDAAMIGGGSVEMRPFLDGRTLCSGAALCGGRAYAMLEAFFRTYLSAAGCHGVSVGYETLNRLAKEGLEEYRATGQALSVRTTFCGTRDDPGASGVVSGIREELFTPQAFAAGVLFGMAGELYGMYCSMPHGQITALAASGNAVRCNPVLCEILSEVFGLPILIPREQEEAAFGAAMTAAIAVGYAGSVQALDKWVRYQTSDLGGDQR